MEGAEDGYAFCNWEWRRCILTFAALLNSGDHIVSASSVFGSTHIRCLPNKFFQMEYYDELFRCQQNPETIENFIQPNTKIFTLNHQPIQQLIF